MAFGASRRCDLVGWQRAGIQEALPLLATGTKQEIVLGFGLDAFGDGVQVEAAGDGHHGLGDRDVIRVGRQAGDEGAVDFQIRHRRQLQVGQ